MLQISRQTNVFAFQKLIKKSFTLRRGNIVCPWSRTQKINKIFTTYERDDRWPLVMRTSQQGAEWATTPPSSKKKTREQREKSGCIKASLLHYANSREAEKGFRGSYKTESDGLGGIRKSRCDFSARCSLLQFPIQKVFELRESLVLFFQR